MSKPSYDPKNELATHDTALARQRYQELLNAEGNPINPAMPGDTYPPGSTFKIVTSAAALESRGSTRPRP